MNIPINLVVGLIREFFKHIKCPHHKRWKECCLRGRLGTFRRYVCCKCGMGRKYGL
jgi:hypothetical protein